MRSHMAHLTSQVLLATANVYADDIANSINCAPQSRALEAFRLDPEKWGVNVQSLSGSPANFQVGRPPASCSASCWRHTASWQEELRVC